MTRYTKEINAYTVSPFGNRKWVLFAFLVLASSVFAGTTYTWTSPAEYSGYLPWDASEYWSGGDSSDEFYPMPCAGSHLVLDSTAQTGTINFTLNPSSGSVTYPYEFESIVHHGVSGKNLYLRGNKEVTIGAGGLTSDFILPYMDLKSPVVLSASQTWLGKTTASGQLSNFSNLSVESDQDTVWTINSSQALFFYGGDSDAFLGRIISNAAIWLCGSNQVNRLGEAGKGANKFTLTSDALGLVSSSPAPELVFGYGIGDDGTRICTTPIELNLLKQGTHNNHKIPYIGIYTYDGTIDAEVRLEAPVTGVVSNDCLVFGHSGGQQYSEYQWDIRHPSAYRSDQCRLVLAADNSDLVPYDVCSNEIYVSTVVALEHANALGKDNGAFSVKFGDPGNNGINSKLSARMVGLVGRKGVTISSDLRNFGNHTTGGNSGHGRCYSIVLGSDDASEVVYTGTIRSSTYTWSTTAVPAYRFTAAEGGSARFDGFVHSSGHNEVIGLGDVEFTCPTNNFYWSLDVRGGRLVMGHPATFASGSPRTLVPVVLGDRVPASYEVDAFFAGVWTKDSSSVGGVVMSDSDSAHTNNVLTFTRSPGTIDGVTLKKGDVVAINSMWTCIKNYDVHANGVWEITDDDCLVWKRVDWFDDGADIEDGHGIRIKVRSGDQFGGKSFFLANRNNENYDREDCLFTFGDKKAGTGALVFHDEAKAEPDVGFMIGGAFACSNVIEITDNLSAGISELGGTAAGEAVFCGNVTNSKGSVTLSAVENGIVRFTADLYSPEGVEAEFTKKGAGEVDLTDALNFRADSYVLREGTLSVTQASAEDAALTFVCTDDETGTLSVEGDLSLDDRVITLDGFSALDKERTSLLLVSATGTLSGTPRMDGEFDSRWNLRLKDNKLYAQYVKSRFTLIFK